MRKTIVALICALSIAMAVRAENYPYRSDYLWVTRPDHSDWLYAVGEKAVIDVELYKYGMPIDAVVELSLIHI